MRHESSKASQIAIYGGSGCRGAHAEILAVAERLKAPIAHTSRAKDVIEHDNPYNVGMPRVGFLSPLGPSSIALGEFRQGLADLGYVDGKNIIIEPRFAEGQYDRLPDSHPRVTFLIPMSDFAPPPLALCG